MDPFMSHPVVLCIPCCTQAARDKAELSDAHQQLGLLGNTAALESKVSALENDIFRKDETIRDHRKYRVLFLQAQHFASAAYDVILCLSVCLSQDKYCTNLCARCKIGSVARSTQQKYLSISISTVV